MKQEKNLRHYWQILLARKPYFIIPAVIVLLIGTVAALALPPVYESTAMILVENQQIPADFVPSTVTGLADQRIQTLTQHLLSRPRLLKIIQQFNLFPEMLTEENQGRIVERLRRDIMVETISDFEQKPARSREDAIAFRIYYQGKDPETVQKVTDTLANIYLEENMRQRQEQAKSTTMFLERELKEIKERIQTIGQKITAFKEKHGDILPELQNFNRAQVERLENETKQIEAQIKTAQDRRIALGGQLMAINEGVVAPEGPTATDPASRLAAVKVQLAELRAKFSKDHPDIIKLNREKAELEKMVGKIGATPALSEEKISQLRTELADRQGRYSDQHPEVVRLKREIAELEKIPPGRSSQAPVNPAYAAVMANIKTTESEIGMLQQRWSDLKAELKEYRRRLQEGPKVEQEYLALTREYENAHKKHQEIMDKLLTSRISEGMEESLKGEKFTLLEAATYPGQPVWPNRLLIFLVSCFLSLGAGVAGVFLIEHLDQSVKSAEELVRLTGFPVLGRISVIETSEDKTRTQRRRLIWSIAGLSLIIGILVFHFFFMDLWTFKAKL